MEQITEVFITHIENNEKLLPRFETLGRIKATIDDYENVYKWCFEPNDYNFGLFADFCDRINMSDVQNYFNNIKY